MTTTSLGAGFLALHHEGSPLLMPNAWDAGSAKLLQSLGFAAIATTSSGFAATLGRIDGGATRAEVLAHTEAVSHAVTIPVSADLEDGYGVSPDAVAETITMAAGTGLAGGSVEDWVLAGDSGEVRAIAELGLATDRVRAAVEAARPHGFVVTARAENFIRNVTDLTDTITRLQAYQEAGADVLFAPGITDAGSIRSIVASVDRPINVLVRPGAPTIAELAELGVGRISVGGSFAWVALGAVITAATELRDAGTYGYASVVPGTVAAVRAAFGG